MVVRETRHLLDVVSSAAASLVGTAALFGAVLIHSSGEWPGETTTAPDRSTVEALTFVDVPEEPIPAAALPAIKQPRALREPQPSPPSPPPQPARSAIAFPTVVSSGIANPSGDSAAAGESGPATRDARPARDAGRRDPRTPPNCVGPCMEAIAYSPEPPPFGEAQRDSTLRVLSARVPVLAARGIPLSAAEQDSLYRERSIARTAGAALGNVPNGVNSTIGAGGSIRVPLPFGGPSAEERRRNAIIHADNVARFARLAIRGDSAVGARLACAAADSVARDQGLTSDLAATCGGHGGFRE